MNTYSNVGRHRGFALPTVLIASIVLLTILAVSVTATAAVRTTLKNQYYSQLAKAAGEAGVVYAKSCLAKNENVPQWTNAKPLTPGTDCLGNALSGVSCPADSRCYVLTNGNVRSSFSVPRPTLDVDGKAVTIANNGFVEVTRSSDGSVWRTFTQPSAQAAVVPDLCSGETAGTLGWSNAAVASSNLSAVSVPGASPISIASNNVVLPGPMYFQKSFSITSAGSYTISSSAGATYDLFIDGVLVQAQKGGSVSVTNRALSVGCHTIVARVVNGGVLSNGSELRVSIKREGTESLVVATDSSWRVVAGTTHGFSDYRYYQPSQWSPVLDIGDYTVMNPSNWVAYAGDTGARTISTNHSFSGANYPSSSYAYFLNTNRPTWNVTTATEYELMVACDDNCQLYVDGDIVINNTGSYTIPGRTTITLGPGQHQIGLQLYNGGASANPARFLFSAKRTSDGMVVDRSGPHWIAANSWYGSPQTLLSYAAPFTPVPGVSNKATLNTLLVGGGGGGGRAVDTTNRIGGGGGGGGVIDTTVSLSAGVYPVVVGAGGTGAIGTSSVADEVSQGNGGNTSFAFLTALGGGGGGPGGAGIGTFGASGGGHGRGQSSTLRAGFVPGQGRSGGIANSATITAAGGGGAGTAGQNASSTNAGDGGDGVQSSISGTATYYGGGGGGGRTSSPTGSGGLGGGGNGGTSSGGNGTNGLGGGGGGAASNSSGTKNGGNGGSGVVIISYPTGSITATGGTITTAGGNTIHTFTSSGNFTIISVN